MQVARIAIFCGVLLLLYAAKAASFWHGCVAVSGFYNFTPSSLSTWQAAVDGGSNARLLAIGNSTTTGVGAATGPAGLTNAKIASWPNVLAGSLTASSVSTVVGDNAVRANSVALGTYDPRVTLGTGWTQSASPNTFGGSFLSGGTIGGKLSVAFANSVDTYVIGFANSVGNGAFTVDVDGGAVLATVNTDKASPFQDSVTVTTMAGVHTLNLTITATPSSGALINSIYGYRSTVKEVSVANGGADGFSSSQLSENTGYGYQAGAALFAPHLTINEGGIVNDWQGAVTLSDSLTNFGNMITLGKLTGNVILMSGPPSDATSGGVSYATQNSYVSNLRSLSNSQHVPMIDVWALFGSTFNSPLMYDDLHPNASGYSAIAGYVATALTKGFTSCLVAPP